MKMSKFVKRTPNREVTQSASAAKHGFVYQIESNVPFPESGHRRKFTNYPFDLMKNGDSFVVPEDAYATVRAAAYQYNRQCKEEGVTEERGHPLALRKMSSGEIRCFRIS